MKGRRWWAAALVMTGAVWAGCNNKQAGRDQSEQNNPGLDTPRQDEDGSTKPPTSPIDAGSEEGGSDAGTTVPDAGTQTPDSGTQTPDAGTQTPDAGTQMPDAGTQTPDAGPPPEAAIQFPSTAGWKFFGTQHGGPRRVYGVSADKSGNIWVAGGEDGLFLLEPGATHFRRFTMEDGLRPYGYMPDGSAPPGQKYLKVISVAGGPAHTVFVGYEGIPGKGDDHCENNWDGSRRDPARYKSGDADRVTLRADGKLSVVHYDIFSGPDVVRDEPEGREKLCNVLRLAYDESTNSIWFGANHGFARADADFPGDPTCNGKLRCSGIEEHTHPALNAYGESGGGVLLTDAYYGVAVHSSGDVYFGGANRSTRFRYGTTGNNFWAAQTATESRDNVANRIDLWKDAVQEPSMPRPNERVDDHVSGMAMLGDTLWVSSFTRGLAKLDITTHDIQYVSLPEKQLGAVAADPTDGSIWTGARWLGVVYRLNGGLRTYGCPEFGNRLCASRISDIQVDTHGGRHRVLVAFMGNDDTHVPGAIGIYEE